MILKFYERPAMGIWKVCQPTYLHLAFENIHKVKANQHWLSLYNILSETHSLNTYPNQASNVVISAKFTL